MFTSFV